MKKTYMLKKNYEFKKTFVNGKYFTGEYIEAFCIKNNSNNNYLGIAISSKIGKAVKRNRIKRYIREGYRKSEETLKIGNTVVFLWKKKKNAKNVKYFEIEEDIKTILKKAQIL